MVHVSNGVVHLIEKVQQKIIFCYFIRHSLLRRACPLASSKYLFVFVSVKKIKKRVVRDLLSFLECPEGNYSNDDGYDNSCDYCYFGDA